MLKFLPFESLPDTAEKWQFTEGQMPCSEGLSSLLTGEKKDLEETGYPAPGWGGGGAWCLAWPRHPQRATTNPCPSPREPLAPQHLAVGAECATCVF